MHRQYIRCAILALLLNGAAARADDAPRLADIFQDGMVLQREMPVPVWGWAAPNAEVEVSFAGQSVSGKANDKGYWKLVLQPLKASRSGGELVMRSGVSQITCKNVVVGEVWVSVGHSIMGAQGPDSDTGVFPHYVSPGTSGGAPEIRIREFGWGAAREPSEDTVPAGRGKLRWIVMPENPPKKNMYIGQYFARVIRDDQQVPVGLIQVALPGTRMLAYTSRKTLESFPPTAGAYANYYEQCVAEWEKGQAAAKSAIRSWGDIQTWLDKHNGPSPGEGLGYPTALYNTRIHPLAPFAMRGLISMQFGAGGYAGDYAKSFVAPFKQWRELFGQEFYIIILTHSRDTANYQPPLKPTAAWFYRTDFATRNSLALYGGDPRVEYVELNDIGDFSVHYFSAAEAGRRAGLAALTKAYGESHLYTGPRIKKYAMEGGEVRIEFEHCGTGLVYQPSINGISGVYLRGSDGTARWADVKLVNPNTIQCSHPDIKKVQCVASGYYPNPHETLFNSGGLPASPFELNPGKINYADWAKPDYNLVKFEKGGQGLFLVLSHVRRDGYVFSLLRQREGSSKATVAAYVPAQWKGCEVEVDGRTVPTQTATENGVSSVRFEIEATIPARYDIDPLKLQKITVARPGKAAEFRKINRY